MTRSVGTPTWIDIATPDLAASKAFFQALFGWDFEDSGEEHGHYHMVRNNGALVAGGMDTSGMAGPGGEPMPSHWNVYLAVDDLDARLAKALEHGARELVPAGRAGDAGRFAIVLDPTQAAIGLWEAGDLEGFETHGETGTPAWFEVIAQDFAAAKDFYREVFDFDLVNMPASEGDQASYVTNGAADEATSGICDARGFIPAEMGSWWRVYFTVDDCDEACRTITDLGGSVLDGPEDTPFGRLATVKDPTGALFQIGDPTRTAGAPNA